MFSFTKNRFKFYTVAIILSVISLAAPFLLKLNLGIDMTGGIQIEYSTNGADTTTAQVAAKQLAETLKKEVLYNGKEIVNDITVYGIIGTSSFVVEAGFTSPE